MLFSLINAIYSNTNILRTRGFLLKFHIHLLKQKSELEFSLVKQNLLETKFFICFNFLVSRFSIIKKKTLLDEKIQNSDDISIEKKL